MPGKTDLPPGTLVMLILQILRNGGLHGYAIAQRISLLSKDELLIEEGSLYPALQKMLFKGWVKAKWGVSDTNRKVRLYELTKAGEKQLAAEVQSFERSNRAVMAVLRGA